MLRSNAAKEENKELRKSTASLSRLFPYPLPLYPVPKSSQKASPPSATTSLVYQKYPNHLYLRPGFWSEVRKRGRDVFSHFGGVRVKAGDRSTKMYTFPKKKKKKPPSVHTYERLTKFSSNYSRSFYIPGCRSNFCFVFYASTFSRRNFVRFWNRRCTPFPS